MNNLKKIIYSALLELDEFKDREGNLLNFTYIIHCKNNKIRSE